MLQSLKLRLIEPATRYNPECMTAGGEPEELGQNAVGRNSAGKRDGGPDSPSREPGARVHDKQSNFSRLKHMLKTQSI